MIKFIIMDEKKVQITVAKSAGFCPGVKSAIDKVLELSKQRTNKIYTLGPLIHNRQVIETLKEKNIDSIDSPDEIKDKDCIVVIRAHGIPPVEEARLRSIGCEVVDATCPLVKRAQEKIRIYALQGYDTIIVGDKKHAEITGLLGYTEGRGRVISGPEEVAELPHFDKLNVVAQTTQEPEVFAKAAELLKEKADTLVVSNTICHPTTHRQKETVELSKSSDLVIVVGGKNSANTTRLFQIAARLSKKAVHIEKTDDLNKKMFNGVKSVFITAGASTPSWMIENVAEAVHLLLEKPKNPIVSAFAFLWRLAITGSLFTAISAVALTYVCMRLEEVPVSPKIMLMAGLFVLSLHTLNRALEKGTSSADKVRQFLFAQHKNFSHSIAYVAGIAALVLAFTINWKVFLAAAFFWAVGISYPHKTQNVLANLGKFFPTSKDLFTTFGWAYMCAYVPALQSSGIGISKHSIYAVFFAFMTVFMRSVLCGIVQVHSDLIVGRENFYKAVGHIPTFITLFFFYAMLSATLFTLYIMDWHTKLALTLMAGLLYYLGILIFFSKRKIPERITADTLIDIQFLLLAGLTYLA